MSHPLCGSVAAIGVGATPFYRRGEAPEDPVKLTLRAIVAACEDAGIDPRDIDGFASYGDDPNSAQNLMPALGVRETRWSSMVWGGGGGGSVGAIAAAAAAIVSGQAEVAVVYRTIAQASTGRLQDAFAHYGLGRHYAAHGVTTPAHVCALRTRRLIDKGLPASSLEAFARAAYFHGSNNPAAVAFGSPLGSEQYRTARRIAEPFGLFDCSRENDVSVAVVLTTPERAADTAKRPAHLLAAAQSGLVGRRWENDPDYSAGGFVRAAERLWAQSGLSPADVDVVQAYDNFTGPAIQAMLDHGLFTIENAGHVLRYDNLVATGGKLPVNTSGGLLAEGNCHGMNLIAEAIRQVRGDSSNPVAGANICLVTGGATTGLVSSALFGSPEAAAACRRHP